MYNTKCGRVLPQFLAQCPALEVLKLRGSRPFLSGKDVSQKVMPRTGPRAAAARLRAAHLTPWRHTH